jgi:hypothetical protein
VKLGQPSGPKAFCANQAGLLGFVESSMKGVSRTLGNHKFKFRHDDAKVIVLSRS